MVYTVYVSKPLYSFRNVVNLHYFVKISELTIFFYEAMFLSRYDMFLATGFCKIISYHCLRK